MSEIADNTSYAPKDEQPVDKAKYSIQTAH